MYIKYLIIDVNYEKIYNFIKYCYKIIFIINVLVALDKIIKLCQSYIKKL